MDTLLDSFERIWNFLSKIPAFCHWCLVVAPETDPYGGLLFEIDASHGAIYFMPPHPRSHLNQETGWQLLHIGYTALGYGKITKLGKLEYILITFYVRISTRTAEAVCHKIEDCVLYSRNC
jgi:hypothetical protein